MSRGRATFAGSEVGAGKAAPAKVPATVASPQARSALQRPAGSAVVAHHISDEVGVGLLAGGVDGRYSVQCLSDPAQGLTDASPRPQGAQEHASARFGYADLVAAAGAPVNRTEAIRHAARTGISGPGGPLPFLDSIQRSFGRHDVSAVVAHTGSAAAAGAQAMDAVAFATGNHVAFAGAPSLHTAAHEAAHVVQQRGGVQLSGGMSRIGDVHERHADAVADRVVAGRSAEALLDAHLDPRRSSSTRNVGELAALASGPAGPAAIYRQPVPTPPRARGDLRDPRQFPTYEEFLIAFQELKDFPAAFTGQKPLGDRPADDSSTDPDDQGVSRRNSERAEGYIEHPTARWVADHLPPELRMAVYELPADCADVAVLLRHVWLFARDRTERYGGWTIGAGAGDTEARRAKHLTRLIREDVYTGSVQRIIGSPYASRSFAKLEPLLHPGDVLLWEHHHPGTVRRRGGHTYTIQTIERDQDGHILAITCLQGNEPIGQDEAKEIQKDQRNKHQKVSSEKKLRTLPGRRIERSQRLTDAALGDNSDGVWTWGDDETTTLVVAGPPSGVHRPDTRRIAGDRHRRISDWGPSLRTATDATIEGVFEAFLSEVRSSLEGSSPNADEIRREAPDMAEIAGQRLARLRISAARRQELGAMLVAQARSMSTHLNPGTSADDHATFVAIGDRLRDAAGIP